MTRLIDADILKEAINTWDKFACLPDGKIYPFRELKHPEMFEAYIHFSDIIKAIDNAPTVDTDLSEYSDKLWKEAYERGKKERPQGKWIGEHFVYKCSKCGHIADSVLSVTGRNIIPMLSNYCPECGADMREEA